jgi:MFS transporter, NNP family, nitrate/nitrite transporter
VLNASPKRPPATITAMAAHPPSRTSDAVARVKGIWRFEGRYRLLHLTWFAFFLSFVVWFNFAPFANTIAEQFGLTDEQKITLGLCNVALTVPARIFIGMALDRWGPRRIYSAILLFAAVPCLLFATAQSFTVLVLSRLLLSIVGAGFVVGIRMVSEWFPPREVGTAEGIYGGWGNFGSAAAAFSLPMLAGFVGGDDGWRWAIALTGLMAAAYGCYYLRAVTDTPAGVEYARPRRQGAIEVTSPGAVWASAALMIPLSAVLAVIGWRVWRVDVLSTTGLAVTVAVAVALAAYQVTKAFRVNGPARRDEYPEEDRYPFRSVVVLCVAYFCTFGSELAVVTMLPTFFADTWGLGPAAAGAAASGFAFMNLVSRPAGGLLSDLLGTRARTLTVLMVGLTFGYVLMGTLGPAWPWLLAIVVCMACSFFVQAGEGAVYAVVPLVKKRVSGQVAGLAGAYGNVGAVVFLTIGVFVSPTVFFLVIAGAAAVGTLVSLALVEPTNGFHDELLTDGPVAAVGDDLATAEVTGSVPDPTDPVEVEVGQPAGMA